MNRPMVQTSTRGFTLIELLIVVAIIGILTSIVLVGASNGKAKTRDAKRAADAASIQQAWNVYFNTYGCLPTPVSTACNNGYSGTVDDGMGGWDYSLTTAGNGTFLPWLASAGIFAKVPVDPTNNANYNYRYYCYPVALPWCNGISGPCLVYYSEVNSGVQVYINDAGLPGDVCK